MLFPHPSLFSLSSLSLCKSLIFQTRRRRELGRGGERKREQRLNKQHLSTIKHASSQLHPLFSPSSTCSILGTTGILIGRRPSRCSPRPHHASTRAKSSTSCARATAVQRCGKDVMESKKSEKEVWCQLLRFVCDVCVPFLPHSSLYFTPHGSSSYISLSLLPPLSHKYPSSFLFFPHLSSLLSLPVLPISFSLSLSPSPPHLFLSISLSLSSPSLFRTL